MAQQTVTVFCRLPSGIVLSLYPEGEAERRAEAEKAKRPDMSVMKAIQSVTLNGAKHDPRFHPMHNSILGLAGRTEVPSDFWEAWKKQNATSSLLKEHIIFAEANASRGEGRLGELKDMKTGFEGRPATDYSPDESAMQAQR
ncbi:hypothetical protein [Saccharibacter floricola]|uniref:Uncharacterized protein n=1 Tax=Saccharibacter floricola DSM 15669 TaxID=1123227 RepID=A0ABQ0P2U6_9PROT|nr:hypothetical protein [Saccharibacter floricola]GBQ07295.1 hypothetical protein AA15669_1320 [Saccharibacter floricola DSM 15669]